MRDPAKALDAFACRLEDPFRASVLPVEVILGVLAAMVGGRTKAAHDQSVEQSSQLPDPLSFPDLLPVQWARRACSSGQQDEELVQARPPRIHYRAQWQARAATNPHFEVSLEFYSSVEYTYTYI